MVDLGGFVVSGCGSMVEVGCATLLATLDAGMVLDAYELL